jgi:hypothetical protein
MCPNVSVTGTIENHNNAVAICILRAPIPNTIGMNPENIYSNTLEYCDIKKVGVLNS